MFITRTVGGGTNFPTILVLSVYIWSLIYLKLIIYSLPECSFNLNIQLLNSANLTEFQIIATNNSSLNGRFGTCRTLEIQPQFANTAQSDISLLWSNDSLPEGEWMDHHTSKWYLKSLAQPMPRPNIHGNKLYVWEEFSCFLAIFSSHISKAFPHLSLKKEFICLAILHNWQGNNHLHVIFLNIYQSTLSWNANAIVSPSVLSKVVILYPSNPIPRHSS